VALLLPVFLTGGVVVAQAFLLENVLANKERSGAAFEEAWAL
jgi:fructose-specific phosphotransferase system IIC component